MDKVVPYDIKLEQSILCALLIDTKGYDEVADTLTTECFYLEKHRIIFKAISDLHKEQKPIDMMTVTDFLKQKKQLEKVGGAYAIVELTGIVSTSAHLLYHSRIIKQKYIARKLIHINQKALEMAYSNIDVDDVMTFMAKEMKDLDSLSPSKIVKLDEALQSVRETVISNSQERKGYTGCATGFHKFDNRSGGLQPSDLVVIAGDTSMGKTSLALSITDNLAKQGHSIAIYSLEMNSLQLASRFTSMASEISSSEIMYGKFRNTDFEKLDKGIGKIQDYEIYIDENSNSTIDSILSSIRYMKRNYDIKGVVVDYIQLVNVKEKGMNTEQQTAYVARQLKNIAKDLDIWVIGLSQLKRNEQNPVPTLSRLRNSGQIEEAADVVMFVYRAEAAGRLQYPEPFGNIITEGTAMIDVAKGRNIGIFKFMTEFEKELTHFTDITDLQAFFNNDLGGSSSGYAWEKKGMPF